MATALSTEAILLSPQIDSFFRFVKHVVPDVIDHSVRVSELGRHLADAASLSRADTELLAVAALLHDIGKVFVPKTILHKPGSLTTAEGRMMSEHVELGAKFIAHSGATDVALIVLQHHERFDGSGYPHGLRGSGIHPVARALSIVDSFAAMVEYRTYTVRKSVEQATAELRMHAGTQFDPQFVEAFCGLDLREWEPVRRSA